jgi:oligosaccharide repeat unit polymerase
MSWDLDHRSDKRRQTSEFLYEITLAGAPFFAAIMALLLNVSGEYTLRFLIYLLFGCSSGLLIYRIKNGVKRAKYGSITFLLGCVIWYSYPAFITYLIPNYQLEFKYKKIIDDEITLFAIILISLFQLCGIVTTMLYFPSKSFRFWKRAEFTPSRTHSRVILIYCLSAFSLATISYFYWESNLAEIISEIMESRAIEKPWLQSSVLGDSISPFTSMISSIMVSAAFLMWLVSLDRRISRIERLIMGIVALLSTLILYFDQGTRTIFLMVILPAIIVKSSIWRGKISFWKGIGIVGIGVCILFALQFQVLYRAGFSRPDLPEMFFENIFTLGGSIDLFKETLFSITIVPAYHDYFKESVLVQFLTSPIPRFIWPEKPISELVWFYSYFRWNIDIYSQAGNVLPGVVGQFYMSWGWVGPIIIGGILGIAAKVIDLFLININIEDDLYKFGLGIFLSVWILMSFRLISPVFLYPVILSYLVVFLAKQRREIG